MGCGCGKKNASASPAARRAATAAAGRESRPAVTRRVRPRKATSAAKERPTRESQRPANPLRYFVISPDGSEEEYRTLAEAQTVLRRHGHGKGYKVESRRDSS